MGEFRPSVPGERRGGRKPGTPNKVDASIKNMVLRALERVGGVQYLAEQAHKNPVAFMGLLGKILPLQITGADGGAINWVIRVPSEPDSAEAWFATYAPEHIREARRLAEKEPINGEAHDITPQEPAE